MEAETIDLTDPLDDLLRQTGWTPEYLQERLVNLSEDNTKRASTSTRDLKDMTLSDLLGDYKSANPKVSKDIVVTETIELSDDEIELITNKEDSEIQEVTEVRVIEMNDDEYYSECHEDDDDEFLEVSVADILRSNDENIYENPSVFEDEETDNNLTLIKSSSNSIPSLELTKSGDCAHLSNNGISENSNDKCDLPEMTTNISIQENVEDTSIITINRKPTLLGANSNNKTITAAFEDNAKNSKMSAEKNTLNDDEQQKENRPNEPVKDKCLDVREIKNRCDNTQTISENSLNLKFTKKVCEFVSCDIKSPPSERSNLSDLDELIHSKTSENDNIISTDLGFIVSAVQGGINLIDSSMKITKSAEQEIEFDNLPIVNNVIITSNLVVDRNSDIEICASDDMLDQKELGTTTVTKTADKSLINCDVSNKNCSDLPGGKSIEDTKSIPESVKIIEQLDMACQSVSSAKNNTKDVEMNSKSSVEGETLAINDLNNLSFSDGSEPAQFVDQTLKIDTSTSSLLKSLDEAIKTCDKNNDLSGEEFVQENVEFHGNKSDSNSDSLPNGVGVQCEPQTELHKIEDEERLLTTTVAEPSKTNENLKIKDDFPITDVNDVNEGNDELSTKTTSYPNSDKTTNDLIKISIDNEIEIKNKQITETKIETDALCSVVSNNSAHNSNYPLQITSFKSLSDTIPIAEEPDKIVGCKIQKTTSEANINLQIKACVDLNKTPILNCNSVSIHDMVNEVIQNETSEFTTNDNENPEIIILNKNACTITEGITLSSLVTNRKEEDTSTILQPNLDNSMFIQQSSVEVESFDKDKQPISGHAQEFCRDSISLEPAKVIPNTCGPQSLCENVHNADELPLTINITNDNLMGSDEKSNYGPKDDSEEDNIVEASQENFEEIRKNLKLQLTTLRNRKRLNILQDVKTKAVNIEFTKNDLPSTSISQDSKHFENLNKSNSNDSIENLQPIKQDLVPPITYPVETAKPESTIQKPEFIIEKPESIIEKSECIIGKPESRIEKPESVIETTESVLEKSGFIIENPEPILERPEDEDVPNVFNEIRKIIRKQKITPRVPRLKPIHNSEGGEIKHVSNERQENDKTECREREKLDTGASNTTIENDKDLHVLTSNNLEHKIAYSSKVINSPFVSNSLDEFLTDAKLNVSYMIPKSGAEEGLRQSYADEPIMAPVIADVKEEDGEKPPQEIKYKPKTLAEKRRLLEKNKLKEKKQLEKLKKVEEAQKRSYVLFKDRKIFLKARSMGKCVASIESSISVPKNESKHTTPKKPSLLTELYKKVTTPVKYRHGPLCKKHLLQTDYSNWTTELQTLPKVILKIMPQLGKPVHPNLLHILQQWDDEVTDDQIEFALSALVTKEGHKQNSIFKFHVSYKNQQTQILTRKKILDEPTKLELLAATKENSSNFEEDVAEVMEKLLHYVEIKEIAPTLIKNDPDFTTSDEGPVETEVPPFNNHVLVKRKSRFTRTDRELMRLNCKVVSVEVEENEPTRQCSKPFCRLGCICKSLQCERIIGLHCQKVKCIFGCTCPKEKDKIISIAEPTIRLPAGTDLLSMDTVTRIEGEAKRNLARVEKEFTQTVIHTNNKTIVVGFGNKPRRAAKTPKKYTDFFDDEISTDESKESKKEKTIPIQRCSVVLQNWDFSDILPYCLAHHLYKCHCGGHSILAPYIPSESFKNEVDELLELKEEKKLLISAENNANISLRRYDSKTQYPKRTVEDSFKAIVRKSATFDKNANSDTDFEETLYSVTGRPLRKRKKIYEADFVFDVDESFSSQKISEAPRASFDKTQVSSVDESADCARTREIPRKYYGKIRSFLYAALTHDFANNLTQADLLKASEQKNDDDISDSDYLKRTIIEERKKLLKETETDTRKKKRKQNIQVRKDEDITIKTTETVVPVPSTNTKRARKGKVKPVFKGEIIVNDSEWLQKLGQNTKQALEGYARILPWIPLLNGFLSKSINVYCITDMPLRLLLNTGSKLTGEKIRDVETFGQKILAAPLKARASWLLSQSENVREIIKWLLSGTLPSRYQTTSLSFLLVETLPNQFEVRGLCTQGENKQDVEKKTDLPEEGEISDQITEVKHKDMNNEIESLFITKGKFRLRELVEDGCDDDLTDNLYMWVGLPEVYKVAKWRVVFLNNDFAFLYFKNIKYSIKYTDLVKLTEMAKEDMLTLILRNVQIRRSYDHASFGLYISHNYSDRIFIGPYFINYDEDEVETLRYINQQLVSSESFNKMTGNSNYRCGHWMYERLYYHTPTVHMKDTIDLTKDHTLPKPAKSTLKDRHRTASNSSASIPAVISTPTPQPLATSTKDEHIIYHNGMSIRIKNSKPRSPSEFNRFIITNIPHFGYLGAYQPDNSAILEVSWPFEKKVLQFENADNARDFLQERFNQLLQPVPETFQIQVIVLIHLDLKEQQPINSDFLSGHCICGYFGTYNFKELSDEFCKRKLNISKEEITKLFAKRAHAYIRKKIEELADTVGVNKNDSENFNIPTILDKAKEEIRSQENIRRQQVSDIQAYELKVVDKMKKLYQMVNILPIKERNIESKIINEILLIRPKRLNATEVVEIKDDDDDEDGSPPSEIKFDTVIYNVESDDTNVPEKSTKKPVKRKKAHETKTHNPKVAKVAPFTSGPYLGPSTSVSVLKPQPNTHLKTTTAVKKLLKLNGKQTVLIVNSTPRQTRIEPPLIRKDKEIVSMHEDTETVIINEDLETVPNDEYVETFTTPNSIETVTINENTETIGEVLSEYQSEETDNLAQDDNLNHYIIEYEGSDSNDPNVTELIVSQPDTAENIDLSSATIIASVPPTSNTADKNQVTVSIVSPDIQCSEPFSRTSLLKTYSKNRKPCTITSTQKELDATDPQTKEEKYTRISSSKELSSKIKLGLQKIINKSEGNLFHLNEKEK